MTLNNKEIHAKKVVELLGVQIDNKLKFNEHIRNLCKKARRQFNALSRIGRYLTFDQKKVLVESFILSNFNYCPLVWHFCPSKDTKKIEKIQERALKFLYKDYISSYDTLLSKVNKPTMEIKRHRALAIEIFKTINNINPSFMKDIFSKGSHSTRRPFDISTNRPNSVTYGDKSLRTLGPKIWNSLPNHVKSCTTLAGFQNAIKNWFGKECLCNFCKFKNNK